MVLNGMADVKIGQKKCPPMVDINRNAHFFIAQLPQLQQYR
jgi:hypothetical protein